VDKTQSPGHGYSIPLYSHHEKRIQKWWRLCSKKETLETLQTGGTACA
jgi:hypothetical protein